jgi:hypothetical protein
LATSAQAVRAVVRVSKIDQPVIPGVPFIRGALAPSHY